MGAGKTTVGQRCAELLGRAVRRHRRRSSRRPRACRSPRSVAAEGEPGFRALERAAVADACASPDAARDRVRRRRGARRRQPARAPRRRASWCGSRAAARGARVARVGDDDARPLLAGGDRAGHARAARRALREPAYEAAAHVQVDTDGRTVDEVAAAVLEEFARGTRDGRASTPPYDVVVGAGALARRRRRRSAGAGASRS